MTAQPVVPLRPLGRTKLNVSTIGFGSAPLGDLYARLDEATAIGTVANANGGASSAVSMRVAVSRSPPRNGPSPASGTSLPVTANRGGSAMTTSAGWSRR